MPPDEKPPMPPQPATKAFAAVSVSTETVNDLLREMKGLTSAVRDLGSEFSEMKEDFGGVKADVRELKAWKAEATGALTRHSGGTRELSLSDARHEAAIASIIIEQGAAKARDEAVEKKVDALDIKLADNSAMTAKVLDKIVDKASGFLKDNPRLETALIGFVMAVLFVGTTLLYSYAKGHQ